MSRVISSTIIRHRKEEEMRRRRAYDARVEEMHQYSVHTRIVKPFSWEVGKFRDNCTNEIIK